MVRHVERPEQTKKFSETAKRAALRPEGARYGFVLSPGAN